MPQASETTEKLWTPANKVTLLRILLIPVFVVAIISPWPDWMTFWPEAEAWKPWVAALVFVAISFTDMIDGHLARSRNEVTTLGKFMDPLADKILVAAALLAIVELGALPSWVALIILAREFIVSGIRMVAASQNVVIAASWYGKAKTVTQMFAIVLFIVKDSQLVASWGPDAYWGFYAFSWFVMIVALVLTIVSMLDYFSKASELLGFQKRAKPNAKGSAGRDGDRASKRSQTDSSVVAAPDQQQLNQQAAVLLEHARKAGAKLGTAESCTGGRIAATLTAVPGSSDVVAGGIVSYMNEVKMHELGVSAETLDLHGAVSEQTACQMADGARRALGVDIAVSVTGIAGPGGAVPGKPVGTVWIGVSCARGTSAHVCHFKGDREQVRSQTVSDALQTLESALDQASSAYQGV